MEIKKYWNNISIAKKLFIVVGAMAIVILLELFALQFTMNMLSSIRAYASGESSWSKAQKMAIYHFQRYASTKSEKNYRAFFDELKIVEGLKIARIELQKIKPDPLIAGNGLLQGNVHPDDVPNVIKLFATFKNASFFKAAVQAWEEADLFIAELKDLVVEYRSLSINESQLLDHDTKRMYQIQERVEVLNEILGVQQKNFVEQLGIGSRALEKYLFLVLATLVFSVGCICLIITYLTVRSIHSRLSNLTALTKEFGRGHFLRRVNEHSKDEIGEMAVSVNLMGDLLNASYGELKTSYKKLEEKVRERTKKLEETAKHNQILYNEASEALKMRDDFLSIASHEIRTPLTAMNLQLYLIEKASGLHGHNLNPDQVVKNAQKLGIQLKKLVMLQEVLMDLANIRAGKFEINRELTDMSAIVQETLGFLSEQIKKNNVHLTSSIKENCTAYVDSLRCHQVITNIITNSLKYGDGSPIHVSLDCDQQNVILNISDEGPGIPKEKREQIFRRFERANEDNAVAGMGLGLYITKQIMQAHNGQITLDNNPSKGASFTLLFPRKKFF